MNRLPLFKFIQAEENSLIMYLSSYDKKGAHSAYLKLLGFTADSHILPRGLVFLIDCQINNFTALSVVGVLQYASLPQALC